ncbi:HAD family hydrolase [Burkholderia sp. Bp9140]|uniref:HAD family hydrolase n=1 Tax=Burkholderia sp. Bp9140 TaxID=2184572 RepID=UPI000F569CD1|nr:HAD family hydrolase [Burkholderia sp. Bp9140]RQR51579.1 HAD family hydrolase [Burkholderia sp. Bp9140]
MPDPIVTENIRAIAFDFDGVILDSVQLKADLFVECYEGMLDAHQKNAILAYQALHGGIGRVEKFGYFERAVFGREPDRTTVATLADRYSRLLMTRIASCAELPGARAFLERMRQRLSLHLVSGTSHPDLVAITAQRRLDHYFESIVGAPTTKVEAFGAIVKSGPWLPDQVLAIGDSTTELEAAEQLEMPFIGIVAPGESNPFPPRITVFPNLDALNREWSSPRGLQPLDDRGKVT